MSFSLWPIKMCKIFLETLYSIVFERLKLQYGDRDWYFKFQEEKITIIFLFWNSIV